MQLLLACVFLGGITYNRNIHRSSKMNKRILLLFCLLTPTAHARIRGRMTVETLATERAACSAWDLDATSDTNMSHRCRPANKQSPAPNPGSAKSFTDTITVGNLGTRVYAG